MSISIRHGWGLAGILALLLTIGCFPKPTEPVGSVTGTVSYEGTPLDDGIVSFINYDQGVRVDAEIQPDGTYTATTHKGGLPLTEYKVIVFPPEIPDPNPSGTSEPGLVLKKMDNIPKQYRAPKTTPLTCQVEAGENTFDVEMKN
ncbi:hypothetical protein [Bremerella cremea]|uniref:hypothetical protein n=1 Tax=Bremerella cremea TaxID=1031537 RepID=UPI0031EB7EE6